jgi:hypothetical protein
MSEWACAFIIQDAPAHKPPTITMNRGPYRSAIKPSTGASHVFTKIRMVNASWMLAVCQCVSLRMGLTNTVQPYCMLDNVTVDSTITTSCPQRF